MDTPLPNEMVYLVPDKLLLEAGIIKKNDREDFLFDREYKNSIFNDRASCVTTEVLNMIKTETNQESNLIELAQNVSSMDTEYSLAIKAEPEVLDEIENAQFVIKFEDAKQESNLLESQESIGNAVLDYKTPTSFLTENEVQLKSETINYIEKMGGIVHEDWKIKSEELDIKGEDLEQEDTSILSAGLSEDVSKPTYEKSHKCGEQTVLESNLQNKLPKSVNFLNNQVSKCHRCNFKTFQGESLTEHHFVHNISSLDEFDLFNCCCRYKFKCSKCKYQSCYKSNLNRHLLQHKNPQDVKKFKCNNCDYRTIHKCDLKTHMLRHYTSEDVIKYKFNDRECWIFEKGNLRTLKQFQCDQCKFETIHNKSFRMHLLRHVKSEDVKKFKCSDCDYRTFRKGGLKTHMLRHMNSEEVKKFKCDHCKFETIHNSSFKLHLLGHINSDDAKKFKCNDCDYRTFRKDHLKTHKLRHLNSEQDGKFKCEKCKFETIYNSSFKMHLLGHITSEDVKKYKCNDCDYRTFQKSNLKTHMLQHNMNLEDAKKFQCNDCDYLTIRKGNLKTHMLRHMNIPTKLKS